MVLLDSAPVLGMADTVVLVSEADAVAIVIKTGAATRKALKLALAQLERVDAQICENGSVLYRPLVHLGGYSYNHKDCLKGY